MKPAEPCLFLQWDTDFFGRRIGRVNSSQLDEKLVEAIYAWSEQNHIDCLYFLADADDIDTIRLAEELDFRLVEIRLNMERGLTDWDPATRPHTAPEIHIRRGKLEDIPRLQEIARYSYYDSRFYFDRCFPEASWQAYYATWVKKSFEGGAQIALVAEHKGEIVGYITGLIDQQDSTRGQYELTGVDPQARNMGVGSELFRSGIDRFVQAGVQYVWLATQGRNIPTQRMVQRNGFITRSCQLYFHKWFSTCT
jgi:ribosomal protein S18 acetylase RimI-like enzyme